VTGEGRRPFRNAVVLIGGLLVFWQLMYWVVGDVAMRSPLQTIGYTV
jgi:NitT/TauT family transport system permease protein